MNELPDSAEFHYVDGTLHAEGVSLAGLADEVGTPFYCYSQGALEGRYLGFAKALADLPATLCYSVKANPNLAVIRVLAALGAGADVVSEGELRRALAAGVPADRIVFSGVGKTAREIAFALEQGVLQINVESEAELETIARIARERGRTATIALRVNPDVDAETHTKIATGRKEDKFGIDLGRAGAVYERALAMDGIDAAGLAVHIGSQLVDLGPFRAAFTRLAQLVRDLGARGAEVRRLDLGGGLGIAYRDERPPSPEAYAGLVREVIGPLGCELLFEPGRALVGNAGVLVTRVIYVKSGASRRFVIVDAGMNDMKRQALYNAYHAIVPVAQVDEGAALAPADVVGPVCETADSFASGRPLPPLEAGDLLVMGSAGAYGAAMGSSYNSRLLAPEVLVAGGRHAVVRRRPSYEELLGLDQMPDWLAEGRKVRRLSPRGAA